VAPAYGLAFPRTDAAPADKLVDEARCLLAGAIAADRFAELAPRIGAALWAGDAAGLEALQAGLPPADSIAAHAAEAAGSALRRRLGHYLGGMFHYAGEWYWGVDRVAHLERRLQALGAWRHESRPAPIALRPDPSRAGPVASDAQRLTLEFFPSLRSPYTYIAMQRVFALPARLPVDLVLRPVLPMVMRGLPVPRAKRLYIHLDTKREADDAGVAYGRTCDPVGRPVERAYSLFPFAREQGCAAELLRSFAQAAFAEGIDTGDDEGLRTVVERAGLDWREACLHLDGDRWRDEIEANRRELLELGLWGVPSFRLLGADAEPDFCTWGQDRIWLVEQEIRRRCGSAAR
jgi:2-hydroxychromene-2-carboxylate isomerase